MPIYRSTGYEKKLDTKRNTFCTTIERKIPAIRMRGGWKGSNERSKRQKAKKEERR